MEANGSYSRRAGVRILEVFLRRGQRIFTGAEARAAAADLGIPAATIPRALHDLVVSGWAKRARRGLYLIDETERGGPAPHPFAVATALVEPSAISHWSALAYHGLTEQVPRVVTATTPRDVVTPRMRQHGRDGTGTASTWNVGGLEIRYHRARPDRFWGIEQVWVDEFSRVPIFDRERAILDGFVMPENFGSLREVLGIIEEHLREIDLPKLGAYAVRYGQGAAVKRLGYVLEGFGVDVDVLRPLRETGVNGYRLLDPQGSEAGPYVTAWQIRDNLMTG